MPGLRLALRVELQQLAGHLAQVLAGAGLEVVPRLAAELRERRRVRVGADVARDLADLLVRDEDAVVAAEAEQQVVAGDARDLLRLEAEQLRDAVVLVDDVVAGAEVGEARERTAGRRGRARRPAAEDLGVGEQRDAEVAPDEAAPRGRDGERRGPSGSSPGVSIGASTRRSRCALALRLAAMGERDDDVEALAEQAGELVLRLREPAGDERRPLRVEGERLALRQRVELGRAVERDLRAALVAPDGAHLVRLPDEVGRAVERRDEVVGSSRRASSSSSGR